MASRRTITHEQAAWYDMIYRCTRPSHARYKDYGAKGIKVHKAWTGREGRHAFTEYMGPKPTPKHVLGRLDMTGDYVPGNVAWMTRSEARRLQVNTVKVETSDGPVAIVTLAEQAGKDPRTARRRVAWSGWKPEDALNKDLAHNRRLTEEQALEIYGRAHGGESCRDLAEEFGVSLNLLYEIRRGDKWGSVTTVPIQRSIVGEGDYGVVFLEDSGTFGYYDDDEWDDEFPEGVCRIVYPSTPFATSYLVVDPSNIRTATEHETKGWMNRHYSEKAYRKNWDKRLRQLKEEVKS
jgi:hypothetical protein